MDNQRTVFGTPGARDAEEWRDIAECGGRYQVSNLGRVRSFACNSGGRRKTPRVLRAYKMPVGGYMMVSICVGPRNYKQRLVHRLVLTAFVGAPPPGQEACHNNGNADDNRLENLRWDTHKNNLGDAISQGRTSFGEKNTTAKLTDAAVLEIRASVESAASISRRTGIQYQTVWAARRGRTWRHIKTKQVKTPNGGRRLP